MIFIPWNGILLRFKGKKGGKLSELRESEGVFEEIWMNRMNNEWRTRFREEVEEEKEEEKGEMRLSFGGFL